jgi:hypothetical protein
MMNSNPVNLVEDGHLDVADTEVVASVVVVYLRPYPQVVTDHYAMSPSTENRRPMRRADAIGLDNSLTDCIAPDYRDLGTRERGPMCMSLPKLVGPVMSHITICGDGFELKTGTGFVRVKTQRWLRADGCGQ